MSVYIPTGARGSPNEPLAKRFWRFVKWTPDGCWLWTGAKANGYGKIRVPGCRNEPCVGAHRVALELTGVTIPNNLVVDHLCRVRNCVNPKHMELVTPKENVRRGIIGDVNRDRCRKITSCPSGHPYSPENTSLTPQGHRYCKECKRQKALARFYRNRDKKC